MTMRKLITTAVLSLRVLAIAGTSAQQPPSPTPMLDALDYLEIEQLVHRYGYALDTGAGNGLAYADLYAPDGTFTGTNQGPSGRTYTGREQLAALARGGKRGPNFVSHYVTNVVVEPAPGGAVGRAYVGILDIGNGGNGRRAVSIMAVSTTTCMSGRRRGGASSRAPTSSPRLGHRSSRRQLLLELRAH